MQLPDGLRLRDATLADAEALHALLHAAYAAKEDPHRPASTELRDTLDDVRAYIRDGTFLLAVDEKGALAGAIMIRRLANLRRLAVAPGAKQSGLGGALLDAAVERARADGFEIAELDTIPTHPWLPAFYERHGFQRRGVERLPNGEWLVMRRTLR